MSTDTIRIVSLFAGAGGIDEGTAQACENLGLEPGVDVELHAINHWEAAIETHEVNHPWAEHYHARIEELYPPNVAEPGTVTLLTAGPECTHFSNARGGKPVSDQKRASAWHVLDWIEKLRPEHVLLENVKEFRSWGPIDDDGQPTKDGTIFDRWVGVIESLGYSVVYDDEADDHGVILNAADFGDPQSRERLFLIASRSKLPTPPPQTHSDDPDDELPSRRPAADIIDWSDLGDSLWTRDLENARVQPLSANTMARIAEGIRRHCSDRLAPFADAIERIGPDELEALRQWVVPAENAPYIASAVDGPFLVQSAGPSLAASTFLRGQHNTSRPRDVTERPVPTVTRGSRGISLCSPRAFCLRQQSGGVPVPVADPLSTVAGGGAIALASVDSRSLVMPKNHRYRGLHSNALYDPAERSFHTVTTDPRAKLLTPYLCPLYPERRNQRPRTRDIDRPLMAVPASKSPAAVATPFVVEYYGNSSTQPVYDPLPTVTVRDRFALCVPEAWPWGLDVRYRMLQPDELKQAQGFPPNYEITGSTKKDRTAQIGNAVPVNLARALVGHLLADETPSLTNYGAGLVEDPEAEVPEYAEVSSADD